MICRLIISKTRISNCPLDSAITATGASLAMIAGGKADWDMKANYDWYDYPNEVMTKYMNVLSVRRMCALLASHAVLDLGDRFIATIKSIQDMLDIKDLDLNDPTINEPTEMGDNVSDPDFDTTTVGAYNDSFDRRTEASSGSTNLSLPSSISSSDVETGTARIAPRGGRIARRAATTETGGACSAGRSGL
jgi:hypothetical protein